MEKMVLDEKGNKIYIPDYADYLNEKQYYDNRTGSIRYWSDLIPSLNKRDEKEKER